MQYDFDIRIDRRSSDSSKWNRFPPDVLPLWVADMDFISPEPVLRALHQRVEHGILGYPQGIGGDPRELQDLRNAIVDWLLERHSWKVQPQDLVFLSGVVIGFDMAAHAFAVPDGGILVQPPVYDPILHSAQWTGAQPQEMSLTQAEDGRYLVDMAEFEGAITPNTRMFILCNPHNPVGRVFNRLELESVADVCLKHKVIICSDEIHCDLIYSGEHHIPIASLDGEIAKSTITLMAPSKTFNLAGLQFSFAIITNSELRERFRKSWKGLVGWTNIMGMTAALAAYRGGHEWLQQLLVYLEANREIVYDFVRTELPGVQMVRPQGTYLAWLDCRKAANPRAVADPYTFFLEKARVGLINGSNYGRGGEGFVRLNFGCPRSLLLEALERMKEAFHAG